MGCLESLNAVIVSVKPESLEVGLNEIFQQDPKARFTGWLAKGLAKISLFKGYDALIRGFREKPPIFLQHLFPARMELSLEGKDEVLMQITDSVLACETSLEKDLSFSVQVQDFRTQPTAFHKEALMQAIAKPLTYKGYVLEVQKPQQVISLVLCDTCCIHGTSKAKDNLSAWAGGRHRLAKEVEQVSRAEFKLLEAIDFFELDFSGKARALDLGAAPGGWSRLLLEKGLFVVAVDPAQLDKDLSQQKHLVHAAMTAQHYFQTAEAEAFDVLVNDMKMDAKESARMMNEAASLLRPLAMGVMTLKLPKKDFSKKVKESIKILENQYLIQGARQLYHNRSEVTLVLQKKESYPP